MADLPGFSTDDLLRIQRAEKLREHRDIMRIFEGESHRHGYRGQCRTQRHNVRLA